MPDDALFAAADADVLRSPAQIAGQANRLLADPKAQPAVSQFFSEWLGVDDIDSVPATPPRIPRTRRTCRAQMQQETLATT